MMNQQWWRTEREATRSETIVTTIAFLSVIGALSLFLWVVWLCSQLVKLIHG